MHSLCQYLVENPRIEVLDLLDNQITHLGCNFLGKTFTNMSAQLQVSKVELMVVDARSQRVWLPRNAAFGGWTAA